MKICSGEDNQVKQKNTQCHFASNKKENNFGSQYKRQQLILVKIMISSSEMIQIMVHKGEKNSNFDIYLYIITDGIKPTSKIIII